jgi:hypothetical protein
LDGEVGVVDFWSHLVPLGMTMSRKSSVPHDANFVSVALTSDTVEESLGAFLEMNRIYVPDRQE